MTLDENIVSIYHKKYGGEGTPSKRNSIVSPALAATEFGVYISPLKPTWT